MTIIELNILTEYFSRHMLGIARFHEIIDRVIVRGEIIESYGNCYCRIYIDAKINNHTLNKLPSEDLKLVNNYFHNSYSSSGSEFVSYLIKQSGKNRNEELGYAKQISRIKEFYSCYNSLTVLLVNFCSSILNISTPITVCSLDSIPEFNYTERFWKDHEFTVDEYEALYDIRFDDDVNQYWHLIKQGSIYEEFANQNPERFLLTDKFFVNEHAASLSGIRSFVLNNNIPIKVHGLRVIDFIEIDVHALAIAIDVKSKEEANNWWLQSINETKLLALIKDALAYYEKQSNKHPKSIKKSIHIGDLILTKKGKLIKLNVIDIAFGHNSITGIEMKSNLELGLRNVIITVDDIECVILLEKYNHLKQKYSWKLKEQVIRWINRNGNKLNN